MNTLFSEDDIDALWHSPMLAETPELLSQAAVGGDFDKINRCSSEWALQRFIQAASGFPATSASSVFGAAAAPAVGPSATPQASTSKPEDYGEEDVVEIDKPPSHSVFPASTVDSAAKQQASLLSRLNLDCASVAMTIGTTGKLPCPSYVDEKENHTPNPTKLGSEDLGPGNSSSMEQHKADGDVPISPTLQKKTGAQVGVTTSESYSDDDDLEGDTETTGNKYPADDKRARRMQSNRESARRSRRRKQEHLTDLEKQVTQLRVENSSLSKQLSDVNSKYKDAAVNNRILRADIETLRTKVKMAEESVKRATGYNPLLPLVPNIPGIGAPFINRPSEQLFHNIPSSDPPHPALNALRNGTVAGHGNVGAPFAPQGNASHSLSNGNR